MIWFDLTHLEASEYLCYRDRNIRFSFNEVNCHEKSFRKFHPWLINYRSYKNFLNKRFRESLLQNISKEAFVNNDEGLQRFCNINLKVLNQHAPQKIKHVRGNQMSFMTQELSQEIMKRSRLCNNFLRNRTEEKKFFITGKGITLHFFCEDLKQDTIKT